MAASLSTPQRGNPRFSVSIGRDGREREAAQRLRYRVFAGELGARVSGPAPEREGDLYDELCDHLVVWDRDLAVACARLLDGHLAAASAGFYSASEFELGPLARLPGKTLELGRTCVHPAYRNGSGLAALWTALGRHIMDNGYDHLIGCASIDMSDGGGQAHAIMRRLRARHMTGPQLRAVPRQSLPPRSVAPPAPAPRMPPLLRGYLALGARIGGEPCVDPAFNVADVLVVLATDALSRRHVRHFLGQPDPQTARLAVA